MRGSFSVVLCSHGNIQFVGASSRPGNDVPLVLAGVRLVAKKAIEKLRSK